MASENGQIIVKNYDPSITYIGEWTIVQTETITNYDGVSLVSSSTLRSTKTNGNGSHDLVVNIISDGVTPFYVKYLAYTPSPNVSRENSLIAINNTDSAIDYISGWTGSADALAAYNQTVDPNGLVNVTFIGAEPVYTTSENNATVSSGEYSVDGESLVSFQIPITQKAGDMFPLLFMTPSLDMGTHVLSVRYTGMKGQAPLVLHHLIVMNGSFSSTSASTSASASAFPMISGGNTNNSGTSHPTSAIVGEVIGPIVGFAIAIAIIFIFLRHRRRQGLPPPDSSSDIMPFYMQERYSTLPDQRHQRLVILN
ncbi:hypothetical protein Clacol_010222 [Clathrus columnatus]|uniref:Uncharacterized protein n=1 Tax=Clathrus columnatus TaxID=1419009 RepID=A0AAV5ATH6_9AGAM|nr:hypothetical protein Clacol_010222 [Clathrus columnatus]